jgi:hypothetical protein
VDLVEIDHVGAQPLQAVVAGLDDLGSGQVGTAVAHPVHVARWPGDLGREHHLGAHAGPAREPAAEDALGRAVGLAPHRHRVHLRRVDEVDAARERVVEDRVRSGFVDLLAEGHGAEADRCDLQRAAAKGAKGERKVHG